MAPNPRANAALTTMKALGIGKEKVKPVLKRLLKLYDKNWELIEEDGYRALVDAIFDEEENTVEKKRKCTTDEEDDEEEAHTHELERKKLRSKNPECSAGSPLTQPQMAGLEGMKDRGKQPISPNDGIYSRDQGIQSRSSGIVFRENRYEPRSCSVASPRDEPFGDEVPLNEPPIAILPPDSSLMLQSLRGKPSGGGSNANKNLVLYNAGNTNGIVSSENDNYGEPDGAEVDGHRSRMSQPGALDGIHNSTVVNGGSDNPKSHMRCFNDGDDICKGEESQKISWVNDIDKQRPPFFHYIPQSAIFEGAYVDFTLSGIEEEKCCSNCSGDCLPSLPCACARTNGGEFVYTVRGLVKEGFLQKCIANNRDPQKRHNYFCEECPSGRSKYCEVIESCKGHQRRRFIKECWSKCGCSKNCGNRLVQRGISYNLQVYMTSEGKDWGLQTLEELPKGAFVCEYVGEILTIKEWNKRKLQADNGNKHTHGVLLDSEWGALSVKDNEALCLDATFYGNISRFINHRCYDANLIEIPIEVESAKRHFYRVALFTTRKVLAMEELTWDYGIDFDDPDHNARAFKCLCGSKFCRQTKRPSMESGQDDKASPHHSPGMVMLNTFGDPGGHSSSIL